MLTLLFRPSIQISEWRTNAQSGQTRTSNIPLRHPEHVTPDARRRTNSPKYVLITNLLLLSSIVYSRRSTSTVTHPHKMPYLATHYLTISVRNPVSHICFSKTVQELCCFCVPSLFSFCMVACISSDFLARPFLGHNKIIDHVSQTQSMLVMPQSQLFQTLLHATA